jgi:hypothetical protein
MMRAGKETEQNYERTQENTKELTEDETDTLQLLLEKHLLTRNLPDLAVLAGHPLFLVHYHDLKESIRLIMDTAHRNGRTKTMLREAKKALPKLAADIKNILPHLTHISLTTKENSRLVLLTKLKQTCASLADLHRIASLTDKEITAKRLAAPNLKNFLLLLSGESLGYQLAALFQMCEAYQVLDILEDKTVNYFDILRKKDALMQPNSRSRRSLRPKSRS